MKVRWSQIGANRREGRDSRSRRATDTTGRFLRPWSVSAQQLKLLQRPKPIIDIVADTSCISDAFCSIWTPVKVIIASPEHTKAR